MTHVRRSSWMPPPPSPTSVSGTSIPACSGATVTTNCEAADRLGVRNEGTGPDQIGVSGADVTFNPSGSGVVTIGVITTEFDCGTPLVPTLTITLTANADLVATQALLRNLTISAPTPRPAPHGLSRWF
ncbi:MAG: hypothetical protein R3F37_01530 [Candidatus Competibacteraceae bacterium]